ncbi:hypothetical protein [Bacteroides acidifaciens]|uniref:hypothetical protein n=1 Tax=Bacteroides acidifaciens TaxID=85831 RepID=UPI0026EE1B9E|nr:hypothetical protein [Bacteroides acidifaciens]
MAVVKNIQSFKAPPENIDLFINNHQVYYRSNMEFVRGVLDVSNGGTGNHYFIDDRVLIYKNRKIIASTITIQELDSLSGIPTTNDKGDPVNLSTLLNGKVSTISTSEGHKLDMGEGCDVKLPDFLLRAGGEITGNLTVDKDFKVGSLKMAWDDITKCISFSIV